MERRVSALAWGLVLIGVALSRPMAAEVSTRECILFAPEAPEQTYRLAASTTATIATQQFHILSASDAVFQATVFFKDSFMPASSRIRFNFLVDGTSAGRVGSPIEYFYRTPANTAGGVEVRGFFQGISAGTHTLSVTAANPNSFEEEIQGIFITTMFVDSSELVATDQRQTSQFAGANNWTTVASVTVPALANRHLFASTYLRGTAPGAVQFRYVLGGVVQDTISFDFRNREDGLVFPIVLKNVTQGQVLQVQAKGFSTTLTITELIAQTLLTYSVLEASSTSPVTINNDWNYYQVTLSPPIYLNELSMSGPVGSSPTQHGTCEFGYGYLSLSQMDSTETEVRLSLFENGVTFDFDIGVQAFSPDPVSSLYQHHSDWGCGVGLFSDRTYQVGHLLRGLCAPSSSTNISVGKRRFQIIVLPAPQTFGHTCTLSPTTPNCPYTCQMTLPLLDTAARNFCN